MKVGGNCVSSQIIIEKSWTPVPPGKHHFNMKGSSVDGRDVWDVKKLLEVNDFRKDRQCLTEVE